MILPRFRSGLVVPHWLRLAPTPRLWAAARTPAPDRRPTAARPPGAGQPVRSVLLYSHDTYGLGHLRRNTAIAHALLARDPGLSVTLLSGSSMTDQLPVPAGISVVRLPSVVKVGADQYRPVDPSQTLPALRAERAATISETLLRLRPDVFLVDHAPLGMKGELSLALRTARRLLPSTRVVLGLRDILDDRAVVRQAWREQGVYRAMEAFYDQILVYGSRELFDVTVEYGFPASVRERTTFTGYIAKDRGLEAPIALDAAWAEAAPESSRVLVMGGGGADAAALFTLFLQAWPAIQGAVAAHAVLVTGPLMDDDVRRSLVQASDGVAGITPVAFSPFMLSLVAAADLVVSMGGYNSVTEVVAAGKPLVCCPRVAPRTEQLIRATILERLGLARVVRLDSRPTELAQAIRQALADPALPRGAARRLIDLDGGHRVADELLRVATEPVSRRREPVPA